MSHGNHGAKQKIQDYAQQATELAHDARDRVVTVSKQAVHKVDQQAHKKPWIFVGVAAFFASMFGFLIGRKSKD